MSTIVRHATYELQGSDGEDQSLTLKKWSANKLFLLVRDLGAMLEEALDGINTETINEVQLITRLIVALCASKKRAVRVVRESVEKPSLTDNQILEWDPEDFLGVLSAIFDLNLTEALGKNFQKLLGTVMKTGENNRPPILSRS